MNWQDFPSPVLTPGPPGSWDDANVYAPCVVRDGGTYHMWYTGDGEGAGIGYTHTTAP